MSTSSTAAHEPNTTPATKPTRTGRSSDIRAALQDEIESGLLVPGTPLDEKALADRFGVSRTPVREALQQLAAAELVQIEPHVGAHVARMSIAELRAMLEYLSEMESLCAKLAARRVDPVLRAALTAALDQGRAAIACGAEGFRAANDAFHELLYTGCHSIYLAAQIRKARRLLQRYRSHEHMSVERALKSQAGHERIAEAVLRSDEVGAAQAMLDHLPNGTSGFSEFLAKLPMHFFEPGPGSALRN